MFSVCITFVLSLLKKKEEKKKEMSISKEFFPRDCVHLPYGSLELISGLHNHDIRGQDLECDTDPVSRALRRR